MIYDTAVIGAGINGCAAAHFLTGGGEKVVLFDREGIAAGGSGAAGAFISPKISKGGPLRKLMEEAYLFSLEFYRTFFPALIRVAPLLHLAKYGDENEKVAAFKSATTLPQLPPEDCPLVLQSETEAFERVLLSQSGLVDAAGVCRALASNARFVRKEIDIIEYEDGFWHLGTIRAKKVILATGAYRPVVSMPHIALRAVWGHRIDIETDTPVPCHLHQYVSIASTDEAGRSAIGATHDVHFHPETAQRPYDIEAGRAQLLQKADQTLKLQNVRVLKDYTGLRSGSNDYLPMAGRVADAEATLRKFPKMAVGEKHDPSEFIDYPNLFMLNGTGGYGFVLGPLLAKRLAEHMLHGKPVPAAVDPSRFVPRWAKRR